MLFFLFIFQLLDHNVQKIVDLGFSVEQAEYALRQNRNNVERALRTLLVIIYFNTFQRGKIFHIGFLS